MDKPSEGNDLQGADVAEVPEVWRDGGLRMEEAVKFSGLRRSMVFQLVRTGAVVSSKIGGCRIIARRSLVTLLGKGVTHAA